MGRLKSDLQEKFCQLVVLTPMQNAKAYREAGYTYNNPLTASKNAWNLLQQPHIQRRLNELRAIVDARALRNSDDIIYELEKLAFFNPQELFDEKNELIPIKELPDHVAAGIAGLDVSTITLQNGKIKTTTKIKLPDKKAALHILARAHGMYDKEEKEKKKRKLLIGDEAYKMLMAAKEKMDLIKDATPKQIEAMKTAKAIEKAQDVEVEEIP